MSDDLAVCRANLAATEEALLDATDRIEAARKLCRDQIRQWRDEKKGWPWIKDQPTWLAFERLLGS